MNIVSSINNSSIENNNNNTSNIPLKRTRAKRSCDFCRKRKARCDADHSIPCSNCRAWGFTCEFLAVRKKRGPPSVYVENLETRCKKMEALLTQLTKKSIKEIEENDFCIEKCRYDMIDDNLSTSTSSGDEDEEEINKHHQPQHSSIEETLANLDLEDYDSIKYTGISAGIHLFNDDLFKSKSFVQCPGRKDVALQLMPQNEILVVQTNASSITGKYTRLDVGFSLTSSIFDQQHKKEHLTQLPKNDLPSYTILQKACQLYFTHIHKFLPIVNKARFEAYDLKPCNILAQAVLAVAFRFASRHFPKLFKKSDAYANTYFRKVMLRLQDSYRARLRHVQAALLMTLYLDMDETDIESVQWYTLGKAIRMAQDIGLHRSCSNWNLPPSEIETRHRVFYACYILDRFMSARAGKPLTILDRDFDTDLPVPHEVYDDQRVSSDAPIYQHFIALIKLSEILGRILKALYAPKSKHSNTNAGLDDPTILAVLDRRLKNWKATHLGETHVVSEAEKVNLSLIYYTTMLLLHRPFIELPFGNTALATESRRACENAAHNIMVIVKQKQSLMNDPDSYSPLCLPTFFVYSMFQSSLIHLALVFKNPDSLFRLRRLSHSVTVLQEHGEQLACARRAHHILKMLIDVHSIQLDRISLSANDDYSHLISDSELSTATHPENADQNNQPRFDNSIGHDVMPKSNWYQRMMNTSIVGGITPDLHQGIEQDTSDGMYYSKATKPLYPMPNDDDNTLYEKSTISSTPTTSSSNLHFINDPYPTVYSQVPRSANPAYHPPSSSSFTPNYVNYQSPIMTSTPDNYPLSYVSVPQSHTSPQQQPSPHSATPSLPPSSLNWNDWGTYLGQQHNTPFPSSDHHSRPYLHD